MIKKFMKLMLVAATFCGNASAQEAPLFARGEMSTPVNHTGTVWLHELTAADSVFHYNITQATFAKGARLNWHVHPGGQILLITDGEGYYQEKGKPRQTVRKGDVIKCAPGVEHWHGATETKEVVYLATTPVQKGKTIWVRKLSDAAYAGKE